jgi:hypothetical protein
MNDWFDPANVALLLTLDTSRYTQTKDEDEHND